jgi:hypothetical protein
MYPLYRLALTIPKIELRDIDKCAKPKLIACVSGAYSGENLRHFT